MKDASFTRSAGGMQEEFKKGGGWKVREAAAAAAARGAENARARHGRTPGRAAFLPSISALEPRAHESQPGGQPPTRPPARWQCQCRGPRPPKHGGKVRAPQSRRPVGFQILLKSPRRDWLGRPVGRDPFR
ncbi:hypothetical protein VFPFJ_03341 [Purpureocillium lilacinum]|uniref:Uncharacterized protein n=1 Tax=Purpureocillium lilacinum TaxID=33203 RepID=A0A179HPY3_PURLI|nr:hypothetical protein VFPFJ_03341 [Purpureocillium lilacinum]OAQ91601.1 hypothetical protein VFPFJ_03341 [Purpureocillium lilacinum]